MTAIRLTLPGSHVEQLGICKQSGHYHRIARARVRRVDQMSSTMFSPRAPESRGRSSRLLSAAPRAGGGQRPTLRRPWRRLIFQLLDWRGECNRPHMRARSQSALELQRRERRASPRFLKIGIRPLGSSQMHSAGCPGLRRDIPFSAKIGAIDVRAKGPNLNTVCALVHVCVCVCE